VNVTATTNGTQTNTAGPVTSLEAGTGNVATASVAVGDTLQVGYMPNITYGDSYVNITNTGETNANICVNVYAFDQSASMVSCCSCLVTPNNLVSLSGRRDLISNTLTAAVPTALVIKMLPTKAVNGSQCNPSSPTIDNITSGMRAWGTTFHNLTSTSTFNIGEYTFSEAFLSQPELNRLTLLCGFIQANGGGYGLCKTCSTGALGASGQ
jgi:hypothetical protein